MQRNGQQQPQFYQQQKPMQNQQKFSNQQLAYQQQQQQMQMIAKAKAAGLTMDEIYGDEMDDYYDEEMDGQIDAQQLAYYQQQQQYAQQYASGGFADSSSGGDALIAEGFEILEEELDEDYDPTSAEIEEYARYLGMDMESDKNLFYIAKEGLKAPLPGPWKPCKSPGGQIYYYNFSSKELQKDHPCDDYYRKYYIQEKSLQAKKKEENVIKKHIKQQQKVQQQQMEIAGGSVGSNASYQLMAQMAGKSGTGQSAILQQMMSPLDVSASAVDEIVNNKLDQIVAELEDQQIAFDRKCREELKQLDQNKQRQIQQIQADAEEEIEYLATKIKHEVQIQTEGKKKVLDLNKKKQLQDEMQQRMNEAKAKEAEKIASEKQKLEELLKKENEKVKQVEQKQLDKITQQARSSMQENLIQEKEAIKREIASLADQSSGDIDAQIESMRREILGSKLKAEMRNLESEYERKVDELKSTQELDAQEQKIRVKKELEAKLQREKQQLKTKEQPSNITGASLADQKIYVRQELDEQSNDKKRLAERETKEKIRLVRSSYESDLERAKNDLRARLKSEQDREMEALEHQIQDLALKSQTKAQEQEDRQRYVLESKKDEIEYQFKQEWDHIRNSYQSQDHAEGIQAIKQTITALKTKVYQQESKERELLRGITNEQDEAIRLKSEINTKQRNLQEVTRATAHYQEQEVANMESELRLRDDELQRVNRKIKERREALARGSDAKQSQENSRGENLLQKASDMRLRYMQQEIDALKLQLKEIALREKDTPQFNRPNRFVSAPISDILDYSVAEMHTQVDFDLPINQKLIEKLTQEQTVTRQLLANIERNRIKWRKDLFDSDKISFERKLALSSVKDKLDSQAMNMQEELTELEQKINKAKRQDQSLITLKEQLQKLEKERDNDLARGLLKEIQIAFDRYLKTYQPPSKSRFSKQDQEKEISDFRTRWAHYVVNDMPESDDLKPMLGLNSYNAAPKPFRLFSHYDSQTSWRQRARLLVDHEIGKLNRNRVLMRQFLGEQHTFLSNLKTATA